MNYIPSISIRQKWGYWLKQETWNNVLPCPCHNLYHVRTRSSVICPSIQSNLPITSIIFSSHPDISDNTSLTLFECHIIICVWKHLILGSGILRLPWLVTDSIKARPMSTFGGLMPEFPDIRGMRSYLLWFWEILMLAVDYFRQIPNLRPPLACFLSHVHSDHLAGLENLKSPL